MITKLLIYPFILVGALIGFFWALFMFGFILGKDLCIEKVI